jgi:hypothetical protein
MSTDPFDEHNSVFDSGASEELPQQFDVAAGGYGIGLSNTLSAISCIIGLAVARYIPEGLNGGGEENYAPLMLAVLGIPALIIQSLLTAFSITFLAKPQRFRPSKLRVWLSILFCPLGIGIPLGTLIWMRVTH